MQSDRFGVQELVSDVRIHLNFRNLNLHQLKKKKIKWSFPSDSSMVRVLTDLRMLTRGLGTGLLGLLSKLSGSVEEPWPLFLAWRASW